MVALSPPGGGLAVSGRPISNLSFAITGAIDRVVGAGESTDSGSANSTVGFHVANVLLHLLCGLLLFGIIRRTIAFGRGVSDWSDDADGIAFAVAALWLLHPIQTDAVDYIVQRTELLVSVFYAATLYASIRAWDADSRARRIGWYVLSVSCCLLGMGSKEVMVSAPIMVLLYDRAFRAESWKELVVGTGSRLWFYVALLATAIWLAVLVSSGARDTTAGFASGLPWYQYLYSQAWAITRYMRLLIWPSALTYDYGQLPITGGAGVAGAILLVALGVGSIVAWTRDRWRWLGFLGAWFFLLLGPSSSVVPIRTEIAAERRIYLASAAVIVLLVVGVVALVRRLSRTRPADSTRLHVAARVAFVAAIAMLGVVTFRRSQLYNDPAALWRDTIAKRPTNARAYDNLAAIILASDTTRRADAEQLFEKAIAVDSTYLNAWTNLADVELRSGRTADARATLEHVLRIEPRYVDADARLGGVLARQGDMSHAIPILERAAAAAPTDDIYVTLASAYLQTNRPDDATKALERAVQLNPSRSDAAAYLGVELAQEGHGDQAIPYLEIAARGPAAEPLIFALLSLSYAQVGDQNAATQQASVAAQRAGKDERVYLTVGQAMLLVNRPADAAGFFEAGVRVAPLDPEAITRLGIAEAAQGDNRNAERRFREALGLTPDYGPAEEALAHLRGER
ncbi:MAG TPA: tetratricopeptide repeat protein [Gemmatimonadaceae bacterium]